MSELHTIVTNTERSPATASEMRVSYDPRQWKLMASSLLLLLLALGIVVWHDRDFWFPDEPDTEAEDTVESSPVAKVEPTQPASKVSKATRSRHQAANQAAPPVVQAPAPPMAATATRTVLPPLEVEVVAGDTHRTIRPGNGSSVHVDLQPNMPAQPATDANAASNEPPSTDGSSSSAGSNNTGSESAASVTRDASERVQMSTDTSDLVSRSVRPNYPLLARQMKVQGSVILQALIGKDGIIQNLRVVSGPRILASAAQDAVRQWHFKPHLEGSEAVETQAKITVNFTISTN
jgi:protein TonB